MKLNILKVARYDYLSTFITVIGIIVFIFFVLVLLIMPSMFLPFLLILLVLGVLFYLRYRFLQGEINRLKDNVAIAKLKNIGGERANIFINLSFTHEEVDYHKRIMLLGSVLFRKKLEKIDEFKVVFDKENKKRIYLTHFY
ncbi:hypothetical protein CI105_06310 [Candidatus Izimaplasma bacterium ZiA1]|uniref:hypothetical protein n=1 Tax=Candidatus Izimoplasma sp. ZiA1 TaxID=2024899 RepID=UPI000BAA49AA|nr:hypothetical protein CI105_06310 [Candidatus Izimaplasma bacterium ZiA1]